MASVEWVAVRRKPPHSPLEIRNSTPFSMIELDVVDPEDAQKDTGEESGPTFWRSPATLSQDASADEEASSSGEEDTEFGPGMSEPPGGASRRQFLQLMGAAMAMAGLTGCRRPEEKILPYSRKPEEVIPGIPQEYATGMPFRDVLRPVLVESHEGRPSKVEGNGDHPVGQTGTSGFEQASVLNLYDPDRSRTVRREGSEASWSDFVSFCRQLGEQSAQKNVAVLVEENPSPTVQAMRQRMADRFGSLQWVTYSATGDNPARLGMQQAFGRPLRPRYDLDEAEVILSLDSDFLDGRHRDFLHNTQAFAEGRRLEGPEGDMSRLYAVESQFSSTGGSADHRLRMQARRIRAFAAALGAELGVGTAPDADWSQKEQIYAREIARDLQEAGERAVVLAGESQPPELHALAMAINQELGGIGTTVTLYDTDADAQSSQSEAFAGLVDDMKADEIDALFMVGVNPVYDAPASLGFEEALSNVQDTVHCGLLRDETARASRWHVPRTHYLESWGDGHAYDGTLSVIQPLISPLYDDAHSEIEVLNLIATGVDATGYDLVREQWRNRLSGGFEEQWRQVLHDGYLEDSQFDRASVGSARVPDVSAPSGDDLEVVFRQDPKLLDGRFSNNAWMQELPDPVTKIVWDNVAVMSQATAEELGLEVTYSEDNFYADRVELSVNDSTVELPIWIQPGHPDGSITVNLGYGRTIATTREGYETPFWDVSDEQNVYNPEPIAGGLDDDGSPVDVVGVNVAPLRPEQGTVAGGASVSKVDSGYMIVTTQEEGSMKGRPIVRWATLDEFKEDPYFVDKNQTPVPELGHGGDGHAPEEGSVQEPQEYGLAAGTGTAAHTINDVPKEARSGGNGPSSGGDEGGHGGQEQGDGHGGDGHGETEGAKNVEGYQEYPMIWEDEVPHDLGGRSPEGSAGLQGQPLLPEPVGHVHRPQHLHGLQRLCGGLYERKQRAGGGQGGGQQRAPHVLDSDGPLLRVRGGGRPRGSGDDDAAGDVPALRERAVRVGVSGGSDGPLARRHEPDDLQPVRRHPILRQQLPLQGAALQLLQLDEEPAHRGADGPESERHGALARRHGEVLLVRAAHPGEPAAGRQREPGPVPERDRDGLPAGVPDERDHVRRPQQPGERRRPREGEPTPVRVAVVPQYEAAPVVPGPRSQHEPTDRRGAVRRRGGGLPGRGVSPNVLGPHCNTVELT